MHIVIDIPEDAYNYIKANGVRIPYYKLTDAIKSGTPLPKGHGRLIDADELKKAYDERIIHLYALNKKDNPSRETKICATNWCVNTIDELPTIIEADKEQEE